MNLPFRPCDNGQEDFCFLAKQYQEIMMKKTMIALMACGLLLATACGGKNSDGNIDAQTLAELDKQLAGMATYESEGKDYVAQQLKADTALKATKSGLVYKLTATGSGDTFKETDEVKVIYTGMHVDGSVFDSSRGEAVNFPVMAVVQGFREMLLMMRPGAKARCIIPGNLAYGERGNQGIAPNETLVFDIETVGLAK